jgi:hypothetical protein
MFFLSEKTGNLSFFHAPTPITYHHQKSKANQAQQN